MIYLELRAAEGGDDSKLLVLDMADAYQKLARNIGATCTIKEHLPGFMSLRFEGGDLSGLHNEAGGHRFQRVPPTESRGRVHTSTITVAVIDDNVDVDVKYLQRGDEHFKFEPFKSSGAGGQHRNKTESGIKCIHLPTGVKQERTSKNQHQNRRDAKRAVIEELDRLMRAEKSETLSSTRKDQVGSGMRGDKIRTYRSQDDVATDHITGKKTKFKALMKSGNFTKLW
jgi:peptide chain release factor 1